MNQTKHLRSVQKTNTSSQSIQKCRNKRDLRASGLSLLPLALRPLLLLFLMLGFSFIIQNSYTNTVSAASLTLSIPNAISVNVTPGTTAVFNESTPNTLSVKSDANFGYTLSIKAKNSSNSNDLMNGTSKIASIASAMSKSDFQSTGTNNTWGYLPSKLNSTANSNYQPGPTTSNTTLDKTSAPNASTANSYNITLGTKTDNNLVAGTYKNTFVFTASANTVTYSITYNLESGSWTGTSPQSGSTIEPSVKLSSVTPTRSNYTFQGWCSTSVTNNSGTNPTCSGTTYSVGGTYNLSNGSNSLTLHAMWEEKENSTANFRCSSLSSVGKTSVITDDRDGTKYTVAKLADNKCWMTQNLKIQNKTLTTSDSDVGSSFTIPASTDKPNASYAYDSKELHVDNTYGGYYTWYTATAGEGTKSVSTNGQNVSHSICPKGWRLPTKDEFVALDKALGGTGSSQSNASAQATKYKGSPNNFLMGGLYDSGTAHGVGDYARYWSSTANSSYNGYSLYFDSGSVQPQNYDSKYAPESVRCVSRQ